MMHWMCRTCGYYLQSPEPPNRCPGCNQVCAFNNVTCYRPECGGDSNVDPLLVGGTLGALTHEKAPRPESTTVSTAVKPMPVPEIFSGLNDKQRKWMRSLGYFENYERNAVICREGEESRKLYIVEEGQVAVQPELGRGMRVPITILSEGQTFGWSVLVPPYELVATVTASSKTKVLAIERKALLSLMEADSVLGLTIMRNLAGIIASRVRNLEQELAGVGLSVRADANLVLV
jgi:CRP-like cAMP-binding protein/rubredoxin